jgi:hypothetical protein
MAGPRQIRWSPRHDIAAKRLRNILRSHVVASDRILEQKISDAGPTNQRIDPHILGEARAVLESKGIITKVFRGDVPWFHLSESDPEAVKQRLSQLGELQLKTQSGAFATVLGQALEIAVFRALESQSTLHYLGHFLNLDEHDDSTLYKKMEPPSWLSGRHTPGGKNLDFLVHHEGQYAGIEAKNIRQWIYPNRPEIQELLLKCCSLDVVPVLIARRIHFSTFSVLNPCGVIIHQTFNQLYPSSASALADEVRQKHLLGYHDVRVGNEPDDRLIRFIHQNLPHVLPGSRDSFDEYKDLLLAYGNGSESYESFAARVKRRMRGEAESFPEPEPSDYEMPEPPDW